MGEKRANGKVVHYSDVPAREFGDEAPGVSIRALIDDEHDGAPVYILRMIEISEGCRTPDHAHPFEHENFVVEGEGALMIGGERHDLSFGDVAFVPRGVEHRFESRGKGIFRFLCGIPVERLRGPA